MSRPTFQRELEVEYFKGLVEGALARQGVDADELTAFYIVQMLAGFVRRPSTGEEEPLGVRLARALDAGGSARAAHLRQIGDASLFISGFFPGSLHRKLVGIDYYVRIGGLAYDALSRIDRETFSPVFAELAAKFVTFVDILSEVSERSSCSSKLDLLRLYETWLKPGSPRSSRLLVERGIVPVVARGSTSIQ